MHGKCTFFTESGINVHVMTKIRVNTLSIWQHCISKEIVTLGDWTEIFKTMKCLCQIVADFKFCLQFCIGLLVFISGVKCTVEEYGYCTKLNGCNKNEMEENLYTQGKVAANNRIFFKRFFIVLSLEIIPFLINFLINFNAENNENWVEFKGRISQSLLDYKPCLFKNCSCFTDLVIEDLKAFKHVGITKSMLDKAKDRSVNPYLHI